jgi:hypothetical protein
VRTFDARFLNEVANHPDVRPWLLGEGPLDLTETLLDPRNIGLVFGGGGWLLHWQEPGVYEAHSMFLPGSNATTFLKDGLRFLFTETDCLKIVTKVPDDNPRAKGLARAAGFREIFRSGKVSCQELTFDRWKTMDDVIAEKGHWFHEKLEQIKRDAGSVLPVHDDDDSHDRAVGATALMCLANNAAKGVFTYNAWARLAGYQQIDLLSMTPPVIDVKDAIVQIRNGDMEVMLCR